MAEDFRLSAEPRELLGTIHTRQLRKTGHVPVNLYGLSKGSINLTVTTDDVEKMVAGGSRVVDVEYGGAVEKTVVQELQWDIYSTHVRHIDLKRVDPTGMTTVDVPLVIKGEPIGLKDGGQLRQPVKWVTVTCSDFRVPTNIVVRVATLNIGDSVTVSDLETPDTVKIDTDGSTVVAELFDPKKSGAEEE